MFACSETIASASRSDRFTSGEKALGRIGSCVSPGRDGKGKVVPVLPLTEHTP